VKTVVVIYGTRPEAIKLAPVIIELKKIEALSVKVICSGQHKEMLQGIMDLWGVEPDITLDYKFDSGHSSAIPNLMISLESELKRIKPDLVLVQGDTATAVAGGLQAHALHIPVAHVEAGLRSGDLWNPWPEESNRRILDSLSSLHFVPTKSSIENLNREGIYDSVQITGNTVVDALNHIIELISSQPISLSSIVSDEVFNPKRPFVLFTQHRREGFGHGQIQVFNAIKSLADLGVQIVMPVHLNPTVRSAANSQLRNAENIFLIEPLNYFDFAKLIMCCSLVISDSGGLQEEVPSFNKKILITRLTTERPEVITNGNGFLVGYDEKRIVDLTLSILNGEDNVPNSFNPFGDGLASIKIADSVRKYIWGIDN
jgi:UDP-N-acetylglucosamine 2-epimerase (non-hydrolysing)